MLGEPAEAGEWLDRAAARWRESWEYATPTSWGRPVGVVKAELIAGRDAATSADWALGVGCVDAESPIGRYAAILALLVLGSDEAAAPLAAGLRDCNDFPVAVAEALFAISTGSGPDYEVAAEAVLASFEARDDYLEDVPVADTVIVLQALAAPRGLSAALRASPLLP